MPSWRSRSPVRRRPLFVAAAAAAALTAAAAAALATAVPAAVAASGSGWRVAAVFGPRTGVTYVPGFVATSRTDAWSTLTTVCAPCIGPSQAQAQWVEHWNGRRWQKMTGPKLLSIYAGGFLAASSARDAWLFGGAGHRHALRWNGRKWALTTIPTWVVRNGGRSGIVRAITADFSRSDLWVFSSGYEKTPFAARYHDGRWSKAILPAFPGQISALAPDDIWATGYRLRKAGLALMHWNGRSWRILAIPAPTNVPPHATEYVGNLLASGPASVWLERNILIGSQGARTLYLMHWNGKRWTRVRFHYRTSFADYIAQDGHGGIWVVTNGPAPRYHWYFDHLNGGHWSRQLPPATATTTFQEITALTWIPGTRSLWAAGGLLPLHSTTAVLGALFRYRS
jgi:hypothetical protein